MGTVTPGERTEDLIISALRFGKKRQVDLIHIVDKSKSTVKERADELVEDGVLQEEGDDNEKYYFLEDGPKEPIEPKPSATDERIQVDLEIIGEYLVGGTPYDQPDTDWAPPEIRSELYDAPEEFLSALLNFSEIAGTRYYVLSDDSNLERALYILDELVSEYDKGWKESIFGVNPSLGLQNDIYAIYFTALGKIHRNWENSKENERFRSEMLKRSDKIIENSKRMPPRFADGLQTLMISLDFEKGEEMFKVMFRSGNFDIEFLMDIVDKTYIVVNRPHRVFKFLESEERKNNVNQDTIDDLKREIKKKY